MNNQNLKSKNTLRKLLLWFVLVDFAIFSSWVMREVGYLGIWQAGFSDAASLQILLDLAICCFIICSWIIADARARGMNPTPWIIATFLTGSLAPLTYLLLREYRHKAPSLDQQISPA